MTSMPTIRAVLSLAAVVVAASALLAPAASALDFEVVSPKVSVPLLKRMVAQYKCPANWELRANITRWKMTPAYRDVSSGWVTAGWKQEGTSYQDGRITVVYTNWFSFGAKDGQIAYTCTDERQTIP